MISDLFWLYLLATKNVIQIMYPATSEEDRKLMAKPMDKFLKQKYTGIISFNQN